MHSCGHFLGKCLASQLKQQASSGRETWLSLTPEKEIDVLARSWIGLPFLNFFGFLFCSSLMERSWTKDWAQLAQSLCCWVLKSLPSSPCTVCRAQEKPKSVPFAICFALPCLPWASLNDFHSWCGPPYCTFKAKNTQLSVSIVYCSAVRFPRFFWSTIEPSEST